VPMYVSIPFFMGLHHEKVYGLFFNNSYRSVFNFGASNRRFASFSFDGGGLDEFFISTLRSARSWSTTPRSPGGCRCHRAGASATSSRDAATIPIAR
jgi:hypothetical protein